jgi:hypothetical protein
MKQLAAWLTSGVSWKAAYWAQARELDKQFALIIAALSKRDGSQSRNARRLGLDPD